MLGLILELMLAAIFLALEGDGAQRNQHVIEDQHDVGPLVADDKAMTMIERLGVFGMQTGAPLQGTIDDDRDFPGQTFQGVEGFGQLLGLFLGEALEGIDRHVAMMLQHLGELGFVQGRRPGGIFEGMFRGHDHQKQEITGADVFQTSSEPELTCDPSLQGASLHDGCPPLPVEMSKAQ